MKILVNMKYLFVYTVTDNYIVGREEYEYTKSSINIPSYFI